MTNLLWGDIQAQGRNLRAVVDHLYGPERARLEAAAASLNNDRPIALIGVASAAYMCMPAEIYLGRHGRFANVLCASDALYSLLPALRGANVIINSRSGETAEVVRLVELLAAEGIPYVLITNEPDSSAARRAAHVVWANTRKDDLVSINVVTGMMTATLLLAAAAMGELDVLRPEVDRLVDALGAAVEQASRQTGELFDLMSPVRPIYLLYRGHSSGAACCGRLALEEIARTPGVAMEAAEFRQGPNEVIDARFGAVVFVPEGQPGRLNLALRADILKSGGRVLLVGAVDGIPAQPNELIFPVAALPDYLRPVVEVVPVQVLAYELARGQGYEPGQVRYISKVILTETGIPNQS